MFIRASGQPKPEYYPKAASTAFANGAAVKANGSGAFAPATSNTSVAAIILRDVLSTDSDYASVVKVLCDNISDSEDVFEATVETGTLTTAMVGTYANLASSTGIDVNTVANKDVFIVGYISATKALVKFNKTAGVRG